MIVHVCERAYELGVKPGMSVGDARAALPPGTVRIAAHATGRDAAALEALATWALRIAPVVSVDPPDGLLLDVRGCANVWQGEHRLLAAAVDGLGRLGINARAAIAPTFGCAWALARHGSNGSIISDGEQRKAIGPLPIDCLRLESSTVDELASLGVERVDQLLALPRRTLPARFGGTLLMHLDQALGDAIETIEPIRPIDPPRVERLFEGPTGQWEAIEWTTRDLLTSLCASLHNREEGATRIEVTLTRSDLEPTVLSAVLSRPSRDIRHLWAIIRPKLESAHLGFGVEAVTLIATRTERLPHEQSQLLEKGGRISRHEEGRLIDTLVGRLGESRVLRPLTRDSHIPERAVGVESIARRSLRAHKTTSTHEPIGDRPTALFDRPILAEAIALTPDGPVLHLRWGNEQIRIRCCIGPERIGPEWWAGDRETRDYFKLQDETGRWLWAFQVVSTRAWFVHGCWA